MLIIRILPLLALTAITACARLETVGQPPEITAPVATPDHTAMVTAGLPIAATIETDAIEQASLWSGGPRSLFGDRRAMARGDILTVVIEIDDSAEISNTTNRSRNASEDMSVPDFLGIPQRVQDGLPDGASLSPAVGLDSSSRTTGSGSVSRNEQLELRVAATIIEVLPNGVLSIYGTQEVRVNFELRELTVTGFVRPEDISRQNQITYDKIAAARVSYGGRGQISDVQQPRYGQQVADIVLPF